MILYDKYDVTIIVIDSDSSSGSFDLQLNYLDDDENGNFDYGDGTSGCL